MVDAYALGACGRAGSNSAFRTMSQFASDSV